MEQQKVLWIIFSVTLFLLVVVVVGFVWFLPPGDESAEDGRKVSIQGEEASILDPIEWVREDQEIPGLLLEPEGEDAEGSGDQLLVYGEAVESDVRTAEEGEKAGIIEVVKTPTAQTNPRSSQPGSQPVSGTASRPASAPTSTPVPVSTPAGAAGPSAASTAVAPSSEGAAAKPKTVRITQYWIQAGSYRSQSRAEDTREVLASKGWEGRIVTREVEGDIYYRVRLGPYDSEPEAQKFLDWLRGLDAFESSYISQVYSTRSVN